MRGCFLLGLAVVAASLVFPAHAGVFPPISTSFASVSSLPRACGGVSKNAALSNDRRPSSPMVFPAHAGVFPMRSARPGTVASSSPRMRGCFLVKSSAPTSTGVFPAHAGVFLHFRPSSFSLNGLPRACGGVSHYQDCPKAQIMSSPRMRGCFSYCESDSYEACVFPAHAGVFLNAGVAAHDELRLPRACGGVSNPV